MRKTSRTLAVLTLAAGLGLGGPPAGAEVARIHDRAGDSSSRATDITLLRAKHLPRRIRATVTIPHLVAGRLSGTELLIRPRGHSRVYAVTVLRDRRGKVVEKSLSWRPLSDPIEPTRLPCGGIRAALGDDHASVSVATRCLTKSRAGRPVRVKVRTTDGTVGLTGAYYDDQTRFTPLLSRGAAHSDAAPRGRVTASSGLIVRGLPTTFSARKGTLAHGSIHRLDCTVTGSVLHRNDGQDAEVSNRWYRLAGRRGWVSALYVRPLDGAPSYCGNGTTYRGRVTTALLLPREAPTTRANAHGGLRRGTAVRINCKLHGQEIRGNDLWYNLPLGLWVSARYVSNIGAAPGFCTG